MRIILCVHAEVVAMGLEIFESVSRRKFARLGKKARRRRRSCERSLLCYIAWLTASSFRVSLRGVKDILLEKDRTPSQ
jgi:hypothetical protein